MCESILLNKILYLKVVTSKNIYLGIYIRPYYKRPRISLSWNILFCTSVYYIHGNFEKVSELILNLLIIIAE